ncbi:MAG: Protein fmp52, mitochondrial [Chaenotheca gracillima]|nr:MAG: Protein fmp52, mitochondrial [Chaenotheca gracillima]
MTTETPSKIGVIICSQRKVRAGPEIAAFVHQTLESHPTPVTRSGQSSVQPPPSLTLIDLEDWKLPLFDETTVPSQIKDPAHYDHDHTAAWSAEISRYDAFVFVTPQYNWGYPASIKNAIDFLFHEWKGKPAMIVSYGGHGGGKAAGQLREVLQGVGMKPTVKMPGLTFPGREFTVKAAKGGPLGLPAGDEDGVWSDQREVITEAYAELLELLAESAGV